jgi:hypothetical protein
VLDARSVVEVVGELGLVALPVRERGLVVPFGDRAALVMVTKGSDDTPALLQISSAMGNTSDNQSVR